jgi:hypothetical protein
VHVPAGAIPKDGPSAGITMTTALASLLSGRPVRSDVAMTGEVSLTGRVLPIGGLKQKLLAASRLGITTAIVPKRNEPDLEDVPADVLGTMTVFTVSDVREVLDLALEPATAAVAACSRDARAGSRSGAGVRMADFGHAVTSRPHECGAGRGHRAGCWWRCGSPRRRANGSRGTSSPSVRWSC